VRIYSHFRWFGLEKIDLSYRDFTVLISQVNSLFWSFISIILKRRCYSMVKTKCLVEKFKSYQNISLIYINLYQVLSYIQLFVSYCHQSKAINGPGAIFIKILRNFLNLSEHFNCRFHYFSTTSMKLFMLLKKTIVFHMHEKCHWSIVENKLEKCFGNVHVSLGFSLVASWILPLEIHLWVRKKPTVFETITAYIQ